MSSWVLATPQVDLSNQRHSNLIPSACEELEDAALAVLFSGLAMEKYAEEDKMTEAEKEEIEKLGQKLEKIMEDKVAALGCDDEEEIEEAVEEVEEAVEEVEETVEEVVEEVQ